MHYFFFKLARRLLAGFLLLLAFPTSSTAQTNPWAWVRDAGTLNRKVATDAAGNTYLIGEFTGPMQLGNTLLTGSGAYVGKLSAAGQWQWAKAITGTAGVWSADIGLDAAGNVYVGGTTFGTTQLGTFTVRDLSGGNGGSLFFAKLTPAGQWAWATQPQGRIDAQSSIDNLMTVTPDGHLYCMAALTGAATFGATVLTPVGPNAAAVAALTPAGQWQWARILTGAPNTYCATYLGAVTTDRKGRVYVAGSYGFAPLVVGTFTLPARPARDLFLGRLSAAGDWEWVSNAEMGPAPGTESVNFNLTIDPVSGAVFVTSCFNADARFGTITLHDPTPRGSVTFGTAVIARADSTGHWQWATPLAGPASWNVVTGLTRLPNQALMVSLCYRYAAAQFGSFALPMPTTSGDINSALLTLGYDGTPRAATVVPAVFNEDVAALPSGDVVITGLVYGDQPMFGTQPFPDPTDTDPYNAYIARLNHTSLALPEDKTTTFALFPNPATTTVRLQLPAIAGQTIVLTDLSGRLVRTYPLAPQQTTLTLDVAGLARGLYLVRAGNSTCRLVLAD